MSADWVMKCSSAVAEMLQFLNRLLSHFNSSSFMIRPSYTQLHFTIRNAYGGNVLRMMEPECKRLNCN